jgi:hypothetical protein
VTTLTGRYESDNESSDEGISYEELYDSYKELFVISEEVIAQMLVENNKKLSANSDLQNEVILLSSELEKHKKTINDFFFWKKRNLCQSSLVYKRKNSLLNSKLENMTKYVRMLNNGSNVLDEIRQVGKTYGNMKGIVFDYGTVNNESKIPTKKFVSPKKKTEFAMLDHMSQHLVWHLITQPRNKKKSPWICHHCGRYGHIRPYCYKFYGYPQPHVHPKVNG